MSGESSRIFISKTYNVLKSVQGNFNQGQICLTETQINMGESTSEIEQILGKFNVYFNTDEQRFRNLAICLGKNVELVAHNKRVGISMIDIVKSNFSIDALRLVLLYRSPNSSLSSFYEILTEISSPQLHVDIILGDFNLDVFNVANNSLHDVLSNYTLIVDEATHISGSLIDHVYIRKSLLHHTVLEKVVVCNMSFTDHDVIKFKIKSIVPMLSES